MGIGEIDLGIARLIALPGRRVLTGLLPGVSRLVGLREGLGRLGGAMLLFFGFCQSERSISSGAEFFATPRLGVVRGVAGALPVT